MARLSLHEWCPGRVRYRSQTSNEAKLALGEYEKWNHIPTWKKNCSNRCCNRSEAEASCHQRLEMYRWKRSKVHQQDLGREWDIEVGRSWCAGRSWNNRNQNEFLVIICSKTWIPSLVSSIKANKETILVHWENKWIHEDNATTWRCLKTDYN